jgi:hypothetical protein
MLRKLVAAALIVTVLGGAASVAYASGGHGRHLDKVRRATAKFQKLSVAEHEGYGLLVDAAGIACIDMPGMGAMGVHYVNGDLVGDGEINALTPEAVVYEPGAHGRMRLVALEYVVLQDAWDANHTAPPTLFGQEFNFTPAGNRYGLPPFYSLHAWIWKHNPDGKFAMWNPDVSCSPTKGHGHQHDDQMEMADS